MHRPASGTLRSHRVGMMPKILPADHSPDRPEILRLGLPDAPMPVADQDGGAAIQPVDTAPVRLLRP